MQRRLPPLNSMKCFEAAGRLLSFTDAANELNVTQAAVSHQIKVIEEFLGFPLFVRYPRRIVLTKQGKALLPNVIDAFDKLSIAIESINEDQSSNMVTVRLAPSFAAKWLSPRLKKFWLEYPEINLSLFHAHAPVDFEREEFDLAVTYGKGKWPDVISEPLLSLDFFPVCSPSFMANNKPLTQIDNLRYYTFLHDANYECWTEWLSLAGAHDIDSNKGMIIDDTNVLIRAAIDGQGVALCSTVFVEDHLNSGKLVKPFDITLRNDFAYHVVSTEKKLSNPAVNAFKDWLIKQK